MKKLLLILFCLPMIGFGQLQFKLDSLLLDSASINQAKILYTYDLQGKCIESLYYYPFGNLKYKNIYNSNNQIEEIEVYSWNLNNSQWLFIQKQLFIYNIYNMIEEVEFLFYDSNTLQWTQNNKWEYYFNASNQVIKQEAYAWTGTNYELTNMNETTYFSGYTQILFSTYNNGIWQSQNLQKSFALNGNIVIDSAFMYQSGNWLFNNKVEYLFNTNLISETAFGWNQPLYGNYMLQNQMTQIKEYDSNGNHQYTHNLYYSSFSGTSSFFENQTTTKELLKVTDLLGRETKQTNQPLFYIYDDGTVEKRIVIE